ncbi:MAG TPA: hypothetical protein VK898_10350, partial [Chloroflexota bacterium]|nr:hypothetical protein [Chloroflexota bacterium]
MTARFAWLSALVAGGTGVAVLLAALSFVPASAWESFVPIATGLTAAGVFTAALLVAWAGERLARPLRTMVRAIEADTIGPSSLREFASEAPSEVVALVYALRTAH